MAPAEAWGDDFLAGLDEWKAGVSMFVTHYATSEPPRFGELTAVASGTADSVERLLRVGYDMRRGEAATDDPPLLVVCATVADPDRAPKGQHTVKIIGFHPYDLAEGDWDDIKEDVSRANLGHLRRYAPNLTDDTLLATVVKSPVDTLETNTLGTVNLLRAAYHSARRIARIVTFSTSEIFGPQAFNSNERSSAVIGAVGEARWTYAVSKLATEHLTLAYHSQLGLPTVVLRPFNVYGPGQVGEGALSIFIQRALRDEAINIHGTGTQIRAWCYIDDMVNGVIQALTHSNAPGKAFNIGNPRAVTTIYGLASTVIRLLHSRSQIEFVWKDYADIELRVPDTQWAQTQMDFEARIDLEEGIPLTAEYYRGLQWADQ